MTNNNLTDIAKQLRKNSTDAENLLWYHLQRKQLEGLKFRRQEPIGRYIVDFVCFERKVVIEVDGGQHFDDKDKDKERDAHLGSDGFKVLRFWNNEVLQNINGVLEVIRRNCDNHGSHPPLTPPIKGGEKSSDTPIKGGEKSSDTPIKGGEKSSDAPIKGGEKSSDAPVKGGEQA